MSLCKPVKTRILSLYLLPLFALGGCAVNPVTGGQDLVLISEQDEIELGKKSHRQVLQQYPVYDDPVLQDYVQEIGEKLAANSHRSNLDYRFTVLDSKEVNAFALPGGYIYITRGLMAYLQSEAELAAVLGHEIGHVTARHSVRQHSASQLANIGAVLGTVLFPNMNQATNQLVQTFGVALLRGYGREHELEADRLGAEYLARTDYNPQAMLDVIRVLKNQEAFEVQLAKQQGRKPNIYHGLFSTHPDNDTRLHEVIATAGRATKRASANYIGREPYMQRVDNMAYGDSPKEGILRGHRFFHEGLNFSVDFPRDWNLSNLPDRTVATSPDGGGLLQITFVQGVDERLPAERFMRERLGLRNLSNDAPLVIYGLDAHSGIATMDTGLGPRRSRLAVVYLDNNAYVFVGTTRKTTEFARYDPTFLETVTSFHRISDQERALAQGLRLETVRTDSSTTFIDLANASPLSEFAEQKLRLLNAKYPSGELDAGELIKIVR